MRGYCRSRKMGFQPTLLDRSLRRFNDICRASSLAYSGSTSHEQAISQANRARFSASLPSRNGPRSNNTRSRRHSSQSISAVRPSRQRIRLPQVRSPWITASAPETTARQAARQRKTSALGMARRSTSAPTSCASKAHEDKNPGRCTTPAVAAWNAASCGRRVGMSSGRNVSPSTKASQVQPSTTSCPSRLSIREGTTNPAALACSCTGKSQCNASGLRRVDLNTRSRGKPKVRNTRLRCPPVKGCTRAAHPHRSIGGPTSRYPPITADNSASFSATKRASPRASTFSRSKGSVFDDRRLNRHAPMSKLWPSRWSTSSACAP